MHANIFVAKDIGWLVKLFPTAVVPSCHERIKRISIHLMHFDHAQPNAIGWYF